MNAWEQFLLAVMFACWFALGYSHGLESSEDVEPTKPAATKCSELIVF